MKTGGKSNWEKDPLKRLKLGAARLKWGRRTQREEPKNRNKKGRKKKIHLGKPPEIILQKGRVYLSEL